MTTSGRYIDWRQPTPSKWDPQRLTVLLEEQFQETKYAAIVLAVYVTRLSYYNDDCLH